MSDFLKVFLHARSLKAAVKDLSVEQLGEVVGKLALIIEGRKAEQAELLLAEKEAKEKLQRYKEMMERDGIAPEMLIGLLDAPAKRMRTPKEPKYQYEEAGVIKTWTGQGRKPVVIANALDNGASLDDFLIKKEY